MDAKREAERLLEPVTNLLAQPLKIAATMAALAPVAEELEAKMKEAQASLQILDRDESQASAAHEKASKSGRGVEALAHAVATLSAVSRDLARIERAKAEFGRPCE